MTSLLPAFVLARIGLPEEDDNGVPIDLTPQDPVRRQYLSKGCLVSEPRTVGPFDVPGWIDVHCEVCGRAKERKPCNLEDCHRTDACKKTGTCLSAPYAAQPLCDLCCIGVRHLSEPSDSAHHRRFKLQRRDEYTKPQWTRLKQRAHAFARARTRRNIREHLRGEGMWWEELLPAPPSKTLEW